MVTRSTRSTRAAAKPARAVESGQEIGPPPPSDIPTGRDWWIEIILPRPARQAVTPAGTQDNEQNETHTPAAELPVNVGDSAAATAREFTPDSLFDGSNAGEGSAASQPNDTVAHSPRESAQTASVSGRGPSEQGGSMRSVQQSSDGKPQNVKYQLVSSDSEEDVLARKRQEPGTARQSLSEKAKGKQRAVERGRDADDSRVRSRPVDEGRGPAGDSSKRSKKQADKKREEKTRPKKRRKHANRASSSASDADEDLKSNLNADAFARSTAPQERKKFQSQLQKFKQARKKGSGRKRGKNGYPSDSDADSDGSSSSTSPSDSSDSAAFVVSDDSFDDEEARKAHRKQSSKQAGQRRRSPPDSSFAMGSLARGRLTVEEASQHFIMWILTRLGDIPVAAQAAELMDASRKRLQEHVDDSLRTITSAVMRRQFKWYLARYPTLERQRLFHSDIKDYRGCAACHRRSQQCDSRIVLSGKPYNKQTLEFMDAGTDEEDSSDMSTGGEDVVEHQHPENPTRTFTSRINKSNFQKKHVCYVGTFCAARAEALHAGMHWQYKWLNRVAADRIKLIQARGGAEDSIVEADLLRIQSRLAEPLHQALNRIRSTAFRLAGAR
ncbi:unnamed protein product [Parajaminaea phylloscopi]